jgi:peptidoglycan/xylan/chitin deacetylase (PgdA/CDA1 family)
VTIVEIKSARRHGSSGHGPRSEATAPIVNALSVDVEDYYQVGAFETRIARGDWDSYPSRVEANTERLLDLFDAAQVHATFFVLGWIAERHPRLVRALVARGHEVASHGYSHINVCEQSPAAFRADVRRTRGLLEDISGTPVRGYRAANFSIAERPPGPSACWRRKATPTARASTRCATATTALRACIARPSRRARPTRSWRFP